MAGLEFHTEFNASRAELKIEQLSKLDKSELLESLAQLGEQQTKRRISEEKESPDGESWKDWERAYALTRHSGHSLLMGDGNLLESIASTAPSGDEIAWGSNLIYAAVHNFGHTFDDGREVPERRYLGISADNAEEMEEVAVHFIGEVLQ
jgi:phage virion morphogenesis protein